MGLGAAGVKAQVRIGGNTAPSAAAVLDLNASDAANTGKGGLVLPRVDLTSNTMQLTPGVDNLNGMMVYNTTANSIIGTTIGIYYWNGARWIIASLPPTSAQDSGKFLMSVGTTWTPVPAVAYKGLSNPASVPAALSPVAATWLKTADFTVALKMRSGTWTAITVPGVARGDMCCPLASTYLLSCWSENTAVFVISRQNVDTTASVSIRCYRPSA